MSPEPLAKPKESEHELSLSAFESLYLRRASEPQKRERILARSAGGRRALLVSKSNYTKRFQQFKRKTEPPVRTRDTIDF